MRGWALLLLISAACVTATPKPKEPFDESTGWPDARPESAARTPNDPNASPALAKALERFLHDAQLARLNVPAGEKMPERMERAWSAVLLSVERELDRPLAHASPFDAARARLALQSAVEADRSLFGDVPASLAERIRADVHLLDARLVALTTKPRKADLAAFLWPVAPVVVTSPYGERTHPIRGEPQFHSGIDLAADEEQPVYAAEAGTVVYAGWNGGYGREVELQHDANTFTRYGHLDVLAVPSGALVKKGQLIGLAGMTGMATGPHLHFEVRRDSVPLDPEVVLKPWKPAAGRAMVSR
jgi:murein DD-endopeptidase MepM/ murein hydrolase activator NlpD